MFKGQQLAVISGLALLTLALSGCMAVEPLSPFPPLETEAPATATPVLPTATSLPPTPTPAPTATPTPPSVAAILQGAFDATAAARSYRFELTMQMALSGPAFGQSVELPMRFTGDMLPPDAMQGTMSMTVNNLEVENQVIIVGGINYVKNPLTGKWQISADAAALFNPKDLVMTAEDVEDLALAGEETVDNTPTYHLTGRARQPFNFEAPLGRAEADILVDYWVSQESLHLVRSAGEGEIAFSGELQATATVSMTMRLFDYDAAIEIVAPEIADVAIITVPEVGPLPVQATLLAPLVSDTPEGHIQRGLASLADGRLGLAYAHFDRALALRPDWPEALLYRGAVTAIEGDVQATLADLDRAIEAEPGRADAYALRAWVHLRSLIRKEVDVDKETTIRLAREDIATALALDPALNQAHALGLFADVLAAFDLYESKPDQAVADFEAAMAGLAELVRQEPDAAAGHYFAFLRALAMLNAGERAWLLRQVDAVNEQLEADPAAYAAYGARGVMKLFLGSQPSPDTRTLQEAGQDLLFSIALAHRHMAHLADPAGGPLQVARIWDVQEAAYASGDLYSQVFFNQDPHSFPEFAQMLTSYWELHDIFIQFVDDPIIFSVAFSPDGSQIATLSESGPSYLRLWDVTSGEKLREVKLEVERLVIATTAGNLSYSPDGARIVVAYTNPLARVVDTETGETRLALEHARSVHSAVFSPDGKRILTVDPETDAPIMWDADTGKKLSTFEGDYPVSAVAFSPDGRLIVGSGETIQVWDTETGEVMASFPGYGAMYINAPAISPDSRLLAVPGFPARVYDLNTQDELFALARGAHTVAFSPDGAQIATADDGVIGVWDAASGKLIFLAGHVHGADAVAWSPDGRLLATGGPDGRFRVWDAETGAELWSGMAATLWWKNAK